MPLVACFIRYKWFVCYKRNTGIKFKIFSFAMEGLAFEFVSISMISTVVAYPFGFQFRCTILPLCYRNGYAAIYVLIIQFTESIF